ncbi:type II secretion system protein [Halobacteriovorax sp. GB3]|uniref:type II secretion system protein n=1 Tax=Halobacteriovorax sp. GB3 TaxID=2719615 RepID=UPI0023626D06|nr:type II secretion system protein [Halobacteriovorax sp. GB3]MDD0854234.1 type II secretion system protein [Halobacteriovorax sp. GB3]
MEGHRRQRGFTLAEVVVTAGIIGFIAVVANYGMGLMNNVKKKAEAKTIQNQTMTDIARNMNSVGGKLIWSNYNFDQSFYSSGDLELAKKTEWTIADLDSVTNVNQLAVLTKTDTGANVSFFRNSFTHEIVDEEDPTKKGFIATRCVEKDDFFTKYSAQEAVDLEYAPFLYKKSNGQFSVQCCKMNSSTSCSNRPVAEPEDRYRVRTFIFKRGALRSFPGQGDDRYLLGTGFTTYFNRNKDPFAFSTYIFSIRNPCIGRKKNCNKQIPVAMKHLRGDASQTGVHESGVIIIK